MRILRLIICIFIVLNINNFYITGINRLLYSTVLSSAFTIVVICSIVISLLYLFGRHFRNALYLACETAAICRCLVCSNTRIGDVDCTYC